MRRWRLRKGHTRAWDHLHLEDRTFLIPGSGNQPTTRGWRADIVTEKYLSLLFCNPLVERRGPRTEGQAKVAARILVHKVKV